MASLLRFAWIGMQSVRAVYAAQTDEICCFGGRASALCVSCRRLIGSSFYGGKAPSCGLWAQVNVFVSAILRCQSGAHVCVCERDGVLLSSPDLNALHVRRQFGEAVADRVNCHRYVIVRCDGREGSTSKNVISTSRSSSCQGLPVDVTTLL